MKKVIMYKYFNRNSILHVRGYGWSVEAIHDDENCVYSDPYYVEIPDDFNLCETISGEKMYYKNGCRRGYELETMRNDCENCSPYLIGGDDIETIKLKVVGLVPESEL